ncbi:glutaredoxin-1-like [Sinocyclocheilus anshuiensis]|uniref:Glutaredoxin-1 n=1 Tax=Sinocyclocheilus anshuiensis TaxID=1608454 RepID=A0A671QNJ1_9TELE|nr:PREDICTED: glutaredoxin-1-like [Sinocyclocheilus anshuiensis]XP_016307159.1 PREDICTED: glutaredoxin-1-like [Sinocyclocheilus anshuiensis]XP_016307168.1 PREDICTED: glutaredoxin-1-like [Sinocyclocheilus anshuiensis]
MAEFVKAQIKGDKVVVFLKPTCPFCILAKDVLSKYKFKSGHLELIDITGRSDMGSIQDYLQQITGARTVPRVFVGEQCIGGGSDIDGLDRSGKLEGMLQAIGSLQ